MAAKWIDDLSADTPLPDAARRALTVRLEAVREAVAPAVATPTTELEPVHQLRVATRRAGAVLDIFSLCLRRKARRRAKQHLRELRRAAGEARDADVFLRDLTEWRQKQVERVQPGLDALVGHTVARRMAAQAHLTRVAADHPFVMDRVIAKTLSGVRKPRGTKAKTLAELAHPWLEEAFARLEASVAAVSDEADLHAVRIEGKRLRYAMEVFAPCFGPAFREELYPQVEQLQEVLGNINDSRVALGRLEELAEFLRRTRPADERRYRPGLEGLRKHHQRRLTQEQRRFEEWWARWQEVEK